MKRILAVLCFIIVAVGFSQADVNMQEGSWDTDIEVKMEGLPIPMPPMTYKVTQCLTKKDMVPNTANKDQKCEVKDQKIVGNKVTWTVLCTDRNMTSEGRGEVTYDGDSYKGVIKTTMTAKGSQPMTSTMKLKGRRVGNCSK